MNSNTNPLLQQSQERGEVRRLDEIKIGDVFSLGSIYVVNVALGKNQFGVKVLRVDGGVWPNIIDFLHYKDYPHILFHIVTLTKKGVVYKTSQRNRI